VSVTVGVEGRLEEAFAGAGVRGFLHALDLESGRELAVNADQPVVLASVFKTAVLVELYRRAAAGDLELTERVKVPATTRTAGPTGLSVMRDDAELSLRDLAQWMMCVSDNTATDVVMRRLGPERVQATVEEELGLTDTDVSWTCAEILKVFVDDLGLTAEELKQSPPPIDTSKLPSNRALDPHATGNRSTPRQWTKLLRGIWLDHLAPPELSAEMRAIMKTQVWPHRLSSAFGDGIVIGAKTGTLIGIRNEAGVVEYPDPARRTGGSAGASGDGARYAVAVFTRSNSWLPWHQPAADAVIGTAAKLAIDHLRS